jgi:phenylalanyl-tRNA synthetase beta chain
VAGDKAIGIIGQLHPDLSAKLRLLRDTVVCELDADELIAAPGDEFSFGPISRNPAVRRDIALLIDQSVPYKEIEAVVKEAGGLVLERQWLFDVFAGQGIPPGKHSLGIALQLRKLDENFTDQEANQVRDRIVAALARLGGSTR